MLANPQSFAKSSHLPKWPSKLARRIAVMVIACTLTVLSSGCTSMSEWVNNGFKVGPNYRKPPAPVADDWIDSKSRGVNVATKDLKEWWSVFNDPVLNTLIDQAYRQNLDVRTAGTRILAARAQRDIAVGNLFPQSQQAFGDISHNAISGTIANAKRTEAIRFFDNNAVGFNLAWEADFWGRFRRGIEAADGELNATIENYDDALVLLISEVASNYVQIRVFQQRLQYAADNIAIKTELVTQAEDRLKGGVGRKIDQGQMRSNLTDTLALKEQLEIGLRLANNRLCVLLGIPVRDLIPDLNQGPIPVAPPEVVVGMPADLLRRRPDLRRAERLVAAQSARIGIATADLYPRFTLLGTIGYETEHFGDLFNSKSFIGNIGPSMRWDILNYGRLANSIRVQDALFQTRVLDYQNATLRAGREVEDGIVLFLRAQTQTRYLVDSAKEAKIAVDESVILSKDVKFDLNRAFVTSNFLVGQQDKLAVATGDIALGLIQVYKALGGGWEIRCNPPQAPEQVLVPEPIPAPAKLPAEPK
ncbi:MAG: efflux transporter outer membrane subunit [Planctomycetes bacterium]|nr:efflux transporter outer membrane subunit [Planctomycetota bacterium]